MRLLTCGAVLLILALRGSSPALAALTPENLALGRPVTASSSETADRSPEMAVDGDPTTRWASGATDSQWIMVDLQAVSHISRVSLHWEAAYGKAYSVQVSADAQRWTDVYTTADGKGGTEDIPIGPVDTRYVRMLGKKRATEWGYSLFEFEVYGVSAASRHPQRVPAPEVVWAPKLKPKLTTHPALKIDANGDLPLSSGWEMVNAADTKADGPAISSRDFDSHTWLDATVPGTILTTLVDQGLQPDPFYGLNDRMIPDELSQQRTWYRESFVLPAAYAGKQVWLTFGGINYKADIWLNGKQLGSIAGAFRRGVFNATPLLRGGPNSLAVEIFPTNTPGTRHNKTSAGAGRNGGQLGADEPTFAASQGWDWVPTIPDRDIGIWQPVWLHSTGPVTVTNPHVTTDLPLPAVSPADLSVAVDLQNVSNRAVTGAVTGVIETIRFAQPVTLAPGEVKTVQFNSKQFPQLLVQNPRLWWPNGYGKPEMYDLDVSFTPERQAISDHARTQFGIRKLTYELAPELVVLVNGQKIFCKGGNWGMDDGMKRIPPERIEALIRLHRDAHVTMIRNWIGMSDEEDFFRCCDEDGILVWNDFWLANPVDGPNPSDPALFLDNARDTLLRYRNHPSIALWCGRNEGSPPPAINGPLGDLINTLDGTRRYQVGSDRDGVHGHGPYGYTDPMSYFKQHAHGFTTEIGLPAVPSVETMRSMMPDKDLWPISDDWAFHDFAPGAQNARGYVEAVNRRFGPSEDVDDFCQKAQLVNYESYQAIFEAWNRKLWNDSSGVLLWMSNPCWPSTVWQLYSYDLDTTGAYWGVKKACEPLHIQLNMDDSSISVINASLQTYTGLRAQASIYYPNGGRRYLGSVHLDVAPDAAAHAFNVIWPMDLQPVYFVKLELRDAAGKLLAENFYWHGLDPSNLTALNSLPRAPLTVTAVRQEVNGRLKITAQVKNPSRIVAFMIRMQLLRDKSGDRILPTYFSDSYFSLLPGETREITADCALSNLGSETPRLVAGAWNAADQSVVLAAAKTGP